MKTIFLTFLALLAFDASEEARVPKKKRGSGYTFSTQERIVLSPPISVTSPGWQGSNAPIQSGSGIDGYLPIPPINSPDYNLKVNLPAPNSFLSVHNSIEKPVDELQEIVPPQSIGQAIIPQMPPPAIPVNAAAANVPATMGAVFLGSGSLGVVSLGNGAYALGSGSIGYSGNRANPRPTDRVPVYPPLQASPNLLPAAVPSPEPPQPLVPPPPQIYPQIPTNTLGYGYYGQPQQQLPPQPPILDQNGYEYLAPDRIAFGSPNPRPPMLRIRQNYATPTALQLQPQSQFLPVTGYDFNIPGTISHTGPGVPNFG